MSLEMAIILPWSVAGGNDLSVRPLRETVYQTEVHLEGRDLKHRCYAIAHGNLLFGY